MRDREIELISYIRVLWRQKWIVVATVLAAMIAAWSAGQLTETYRIELSFLVLPPLSSQLSAEETTFQLTPEAYQEIAMSSRVFEQTRTNIEGVVSEASPGNPGNHISVTVRSLTGASTEGKQYLVIATLKHGNPELLPIMATTWFDAFSNAIGQFYRDRSESAFDYLESAHLQAESELEELAGERLEYLSAQPPIILQTRRSGLQSELKSVRASLADAMSEKDLLNTYLEAGIAPQSERSSSEQIIMAEELSPTSLVGAIALGLSLDEFAVIIDRRIEYLGEQIVLIDAELKTTQQTIDEVEQNLAGLDSKISIQSQIVALLASRLQVSISTMEQGDHQFFLLAQPTTPTAPTQSGRLQVNILSAGFLGMFVGVLLAFFIDYLIQVKIQENRQAAKPEGEIEAEESDATDNSIDAAHQ